MKKMLLPFFLILFSFNFIQAADITSNGTGGGAWTSGSSWIGGVSPASTDNVIISAGDVITTSGLTRGTGTTTSVLGTLSLTGGFVVTGATLTVDGTVILNYNSPTAPTATWNIGSTLQILGVTSGTSMGGMSQNFYNVIWNCSGQSATCNMTIGSNVTWGGDFTILNTGSTPQIVRFTSTNGVSVTINGNVSIQAGTLQGTGSGITGITLNFNKDLSLSNAASFFPVASSAGCTVSLGGNLSITGTSTLSKGSGAVTFQFNKLGVQTFTKASTATITNGGSGIYAFNVNSGSTLDMGLNIFNSSTSQPITFNVLAGGGLKVGDPAGLSTVVGVSGNTTNIQLTGSNASTAKTFSSAGSYEYNGVAAQVTGTGLPATVNNLTINNANGVSLSASTTVSNVLTVTSGSLTTGANNLTLGSSASAVFSPNTSLNITGGTTNFANRTVVLQSSVSGTARISTVTGDNVATGLINATAVSIQRYIPSKSARAWSLVASPVSQALSAGWQQQVHITGANGGTTACTIDGTTGFDVTTTNAPSAYTYNTNLTGGSRWVAVPNTLSNNTAAGKGFRLNIRGPRTAGCSLLDGTSLVPEAVTLSSTGIISNADKNLGSFSITYPNAASGDNYVLVGNPYPSQISFSALRASNAAALNNNYAIYAPGNTAGNYAYWDPTGGTYTGGNTGLSNATGDIIASGQAIFLQGSAAGDVTINFAETHKTASTQNGYFRTRSFSEMIRIAYMLDDTNKADEIIIRYANDNEVSNFQIGSMDIVSMNAGTQYLNSMKGAKAMAVQTRSLQSLTTDTVVLNVKSNQSGTYKLNFSEYENFGAGIYLIDSYTKTIHDVKASSTYSFTIDKNNAASQTNRFALVFSKTISTTAITGVKVYPNPADKQITVQLPSTSDKYTVSITDVTGKRVYQSQLASGIQSINVAKFTAGNYILEITDAKGNRTTEKLVKQ